MAILTSTMKGDATRRGTAVVTGASSGLGESFARHLSRRGYDVVLVARRADKLEALRRELVQCGHHPTVVVADVREPAGRAAIFDAVAERPLNLWVNNAGLGCVRAGVECEEDDVTSVLRTNIEALSLLSIAAAKRLSERRGGVIVNVASTAAFSPTPTMATYGASKAFVLSFSEALREELRASGVRVCVVCPGALETEFHGRAGLEMPPKLLVRAADPCARAAIEAALRGEDLYVDGALNRAVTAFARFAPRRWVQRVSARAMGVW